MTSKERYDLLVKWEKQYDLCQNAQHGMDTLFGSVDAEESILCRAIWRTFDEYTDTLSALIGDDFGWLNWFCWENGMGVNEFQARPNLCKKMRKIKTLKDLCKLIEADGTNVED